MTDEWLTEWLTISLTTDYYWRRLTLLLTTDWLCTTDDWLTLLLTTELLMNDRQNDWLTDFITDDWLTNCITDEWLTDWPTNWLTVWLSDWLTDWLCDWLTDDELFNDYWQTAWSPGFFNSWLTDWLNDRFDSLTDWKRLLARYKRLAAKSSSLNWNISGSVHFIMCCYILA